MELTLSDKMLNLTDKECERCVIGCLLIDSGCYFKVADLLSTEVFTQPIERTIYEAIASMVQEGQSIDIVTVAIYMQQHPKGVEVTPAYIAELSSMVVSSVNIWEYCANLHELWERRQLLKVSAEIENVAADRTRSIDELLEQSADKVKAIGDNASSDVATASDALEELERLRQEQMQGRVSGTHTGFVCIDERGGLRAQALTVIAGYPGQGKSASALQMAVHAAVEGDANAYYTLEMSNAELMARAVAAEAGVSVSNILYHPQQMTALDVQRYSEASRRLASLPLYFDEKATSSVESIIQSARMLVRKKHIKGIFVDYLQILVNNRKTSKGDEAFLGDTVRAFKNLAKSENIFVVLLSQLARNHESKEPTADYLRGSGQIFEGCDNCYLIFRPEVSNGRYSGVHSDVDPHGTAQITVAKCRNGSVGAKYIVGFTPEITKFYELSGQPPRLSVASPVKHPSEEQEPVPF